MNEPLSHRQTDLLKALIDEYIETATPVGSLALEKKYNLGISPATIRNEMVELTKNGYLRQPHTSSGRVPSPKAMKFYINQLMDERSLSVSDEVKAKENVWDNRFNLEKLLESATLGLSRRTNSFAIATTSEGFLSSHGHSNFFNSPEIFNVQVCQSIFSILDEQKRIKELFFEHFTGLSPIEVLFGEELGWEFFHPVSVVSTRFQIGDVSGALGIIGPFGLHYPSIIPVVRYYGNLVEEIGQKNLK